jgi:hypothetical protein
MKKITLLVFIAIVMWSMTYPADAQMQAAKRITFDVDTTLIFNVKRSVVWDLIKDPAQWDKISNGHILSIKTTGTLGDEGKSTDLTLDISYADGSKWKEKVTQLQPVYRFIVLQITDPVPAGVTENFFSIVVNAETEKSCSMSYRIKVEGSNPGKNELLSHLTNDMRAFIKGISQRLTQ